MNITFYQVANRGNCKQEEIAKGSSGFRISVIV